MSLSALPTELDSRILDFLEHDALNAMLKVSKYYRGVAEPYLYRHLAFTNLQDTEVRALLLGVVSRPLLATHIKFIRLNRDHTKSEATREYFCTRDHRMPKNKASYERFRPELDKVYKC
ncbi:hypothetical protein EJ02DRAFT_451912 [Clathrospora elynae]|uniref:F-box domain-containing protein n=1 Tax=Clathrospora elynae TaxID=706981 RepID=A0A6A5T7W8_9PLEO|nr:hypothetical protein EJ02DRAFT_451912 [Clathrospora elynae]